MVEAFPFCLPTLEAWKSQWGCEGGEMSDLWMPEAYTKIGGKTCLPFLLSYSLFKLVSN